MGARRCRGPPGDHVPGSGLIPDPPAPGAPSRVDTHTVLASTVRDDGSRIVATLARSVGIGPAEDALADAYEIALLTWPRDGIPAQPRAWLTVAARRRALDGLRREAKRLGKEADAMALAELDDPDPAPPGAIGDDLLRLVFTCCHPALALESQVALTLRVVCGLPTPEVAAALLVSEATMAKRLTRAKHKITTAAIPYRVPADADLPARLAAVCAVVHLVYTTGHTPQHGDDVIRPDLCAEAIRLGRLLVELMPDESTAVGLLALLLLSEARRSTRFDADGDPVLLADADRSRWDGALAAEGSRLLQRSLQRTAGLADAYQLQAAIASCHTLAADYPATDWAEIARLYALLEEVAPGPVVRLNRCVAVAERDGPAAGLRLLAQDDAASRLPLAAAVRGELLARLGDPAAIDELESALRDDPAPAHARWLERRIGVLRSTGPVPR